MHKLAILQAGIEYVRWLEGVIAELRKQNQKTPTASSGNRPRVEVEETEDDMAIAAVTKHRETAAAKERTASIAVSDASPELGPSVSSSSSGGQHQRVPRPNHRTDSFESLSASAPSTALPTPNMLPTQTLLSPAFGGLHFSPELARRSPSSATSVPTHRPSTAPSPNFLPMPPAMMELDPNPPGKPGPAAIPTTLYYERDRETRTPDQEATATAALMMLTRHDRRNSLSRYKIGRSSATTVETPGTAHEDNRLLVGDDNETSQSAPLARPVKAVEVSGESNVHVKAMSVRDLLST